MLDEVAGGSGGVLGESTRGTYRELVRKSLQVQPDRDGGLLI